MKCSVERVKFFSNFFYMINSLLARRGLIWKGSKGYPWQQVRSANNNDDQKNLEIKIKAAQMFYKNT